MWPPPLPGTRGGGTYERLEREARLRKEPEWTKVCKACCRNPLPALRSVFIVSLSSREGHRAMTTHTYNPAKNLLSWTGTALAAMLLAIVAVLGELMAAPAATAEPDPASWAALMAGGQAATIGAVDHPDAEIAAALSELAPETSATLSDLAPEPKYSSPPRPMLVTAATLNRR